MRGYEDGQLVPDDVVLCFEVTAGYREHTVSARARRGAAEGRGDLEEARGGERRFGGYVDCGTTEAAEVLW